MCLFETWSVDEDLYAVQGHVDMRTLGVPQLLADLETDAGVDGRLKDNFTFFVYLN